jgi:TolB-like protein
MSEGLFSFGAFIMDAKLRLLMKDGMPVSVGHRGLALLEALLSSGGRVLGKSELMEIAWPDQVVEESNLTVQIAALRKIVGKRPDGEEWIVTVPRVGYRFLHTTPETAKIDQPDSARVGRFSDARPSIAVLPFTNLSTSREQEFIADGMTDDIIAALSRIGALFVISRGSSFALKGRAVPAGEAAQVLGVRYVLDGSVRTLADRIRVTAQLTDTLSGSSIWAERYDGDSADIFAVQDDITRSIVQALHINLSIGESQLMSSLHAGHMSTGESRQGGRATPGVDLLGPLTSQQDID